MTLEIGNKPLSEITAENMLEIVMIIGACPSLEFWNKPIILDFDNTTFSNVIVIDYKSHRIEDNRESSYYSFYLNIDRYYWHYTKDYEKHHKIQRHHTKNLGISELRYLIQQGFDVPFYN